MLRWKTSLRGSLWALKPCVAETTVHGRNACPASPPINLFPDRAAIAPEDPRSPAGGEDARALALSPVGHYRQQPINRQTPIRKAIESGAMAVAFSRARL
jgi:hypothetical protein